MQRTGSQGMLVALRARTAHRESLFHMFSNGSHNNPRPDNGVYLYIDRRIVCQKTRSQDPWLLDLPSKPESILGEESYFTSTSIFFGCADNGFGRTILSTPSL